MYRPAAAYIVNIGPLVQITGCQDSDTALSFVGMPPNVAVTIYNRGIIAGAGGNGGNGNIEAGCGANSFPAAATNGGPAIATQPGLQIIVFNYGIVAGGGGGGGGSGRITSGSGGGGGGGAGLAWATGGAGGGENLTTAFLVCTKTVLAQPGATGMQTSGGLGGLGTGQSPRGGNGGARGQAGLPGSGNNSSFSGPGLAGKAITGNSGNILNNFSGGQTFGVVD